MNVVQLKYEMAYFLCVTKIKHMHSATSFSSLVENYLLGRQKDTKSIKMMHYHEKNFDITVVQQTQHHVFLC